MLGQINLLLSGSCEDGGRELKSATVFRTSPPAFARVLITLIAAILLAATPLSGVSSATDQPATDQRTPLLIPGKQTLYQRVLTRPEAELREGPAANSPVVQSAIAALTPLYVYDRVFKDGSQWLELGFSSDGRTEGWVLGEHTLAWNQTLTAVLTAPVDRNRVLFFRRSEDAAAFLSAPNAERSARSLLETIDRGQLPPDSPVIAVESPEPSDVRRQFYMQPILEVREVAVSLRRSARILHVAAETMKADQSLIKSDAPSRIATPRAADQGALANYRVGIAFVVDTTISMNPYIDRVRKAMREVYSKLSSSRYGNNIAFGLVGFRSDKSKSPGLDYDTRIFAPLRAGREGRTFLEEIKGVSAAQVSSDSFNEDSFAGIQRAIDGLQWDGYDGRFIVLVTDAGSKERKSSLSRLDAASLNSLARSQEKPIVMLALHLLTEAGKRSGNHDMARRQYTALTAYEGGAPLYFPVRDGAVDQFGEQVDALVDVILGQIEDANQGHLTGDTEEVPSADTGKDADGSAELRSRLAMIGRAMQLQYLGRVADRKAPRLVEAWIADRDPGEPRPNAIEVNVLMTKNQLSQLASTLDAVLKEGEESRGQSSAFFKRLRMVPALVSRQPENVDPDNVQRLADVVGLNEMLGGLPFSSLLM